MTNPFERSRPLSATAVRSEILSAQEFLRLKEAAPQDISACRPVGPTLGKAGFGGIEVTYVTPKYRVAL